MILNTKIRAFLRNILAKLGLLTFIRDSWVWRLKNKNLYKNFHKNVNDAFDLVATLNKEKDLNLWPEFGTLLGIVRENGPIKHDLDLDFGSFFNEKNQHKIRETFLSNNFVLIKTTTMQSTKRLIAEKYNYLNIDIDVYYFFEEEDRLVAFDLETDSGLSIEEELSVDKNIRPYKNIFTRFSLKQYSYREDIILVPENLEEHLVELYGRTYMVPDPKWRNNKRKGREKMNDDRVEQEIFRK